jgi:hypothetical protein
MKRKILVIVVGVLMVTLVSSATALVNPEPKLQLHIGIKMGIACLIVRNIGDTNASDVEWNCNITGGICKKINEHLEGNKSLLPPGSSHEAFQPLPRFFGLGIIRLTASASASNTNATTLHKYGFVFGYTCIIFPF